MFSSIERSANGSAQQPKVARQSSRALGGKRRTKSTRRLLRSKRRCQRKSHPAISRIAREPLTVRWILFEWSKTSGTSGHLGTEGRRAGSAEPRSIRPTPHFGARPDGSALAASLLLVGVNPRGPGVPMWEVRASRPPRNRSRDTPYTEMGRGRSASVGRSSRRSQPVSTRSLPAGDVLSAMTVGRRVELILANWLAPGTPVSSLKNAILCA